MRGGATWTRADREFDTAAIAHRLRIGKKTAQAFMRSARGKGAYKLSRRYWASVPAISASDRRTQNQILSSRIVQTKPISYSRRQIVFSKLNELS